MRHINALLTVRLFTSNHHHRSPQENQLASPSKTWARPLKPLHRFPPNSLPTISSFQQLGPTSVPAEPRTEDTYHHQPPEPLHPWPGLVGHSLLRGRRLHRLPPPRCPHRHHLGQLWVNSCPASPATPPSTPLGWDVLPTTLQWWYQKRLNVWSLPCFGH